jgi:2-oxoglutarate ferredoxin oxidoreductase subunit alpha
MVHLRAEKIARVALGIPPLEVDDPTAADAPADLLVLGWGSTYGAIQSAVRHLRAGGSRVAHAHLRYLHPFPANLGEVLARYRRVVVPR